MKPLHITIKGVPVSQKLLGTIWGEIRITVSKIYPCARNIEMPKIEAITLSRAAYVKQFNYLIKSPHIQDRSLEEWGNGGVKPDESSALIFHDDSFTWYILKCRGRFPLERDLRHELAHIYEDFLLLPEGTLTKLLDNKTDNLRL